MSKIGDRMRLAGPLWNAMYDRMNLLINTVNELRSIVLVGNNPHKINDVTNVATTADADGDGGLDAVIDLEWNVDVKYAAHLASTTHHIAADSTNTLTAKTVYAKIKALADELKVDYEAHRVLTAGSVHSSADTVNVITEADVSSKATAFALVNDLQTQFNAHCADGATAHGAADTTNPVAGAALTGASTWSEIAARLDLIRTGYEAHRVLTAGSVHGGADSTNTVSAAAVGTVQTSVNTYLNELKADFNAHIALMSSHYVKDESDAVTAANASSLATSRTLVNAIKTGYNDHISRAGESAAGAVPTLDEE